MRRSEEGLALHSSETESGVECGCGVYALPLGSLPLLPVKLGFWLLMLASRTSCGGIVWAWGFLGFGLRPTRYPLLPSFHSGVGRVGGEQLRRRKIITRAEPSILHQHHNIEPLGTHDERSESRRGIHGQI